MTTADDVRRILAGRRRGADQVATAAGALAIDIVLVLYAGALVGGAWVVGYCPPPAAIGVAFVVGALVGVLGIGAVIAVWLCSEFRRFRVVMTVLVAWLVLWVAALWQGVVELPAGLVALHLCWHIGAVAALWSGRGAFQRGPA